jgi:sulfur transfer complex TusBCD TusB component (DsrH family)
MGAACLVIASPPTSSEGRHALDLAEAFLAAQDALTLVLLQAAVVLACRKQPAETLETMEHLLARGATLCVLREDLALRGFTSAELLEPNMMMDYPGVARLLADRPGQVIGCV